MSPTNVAILAVMLAAAIATLVILVWRDVRRVLREHKAWTDGQMLAHQAGLREAFTSEGQRYLHGIEIEANTQRKRLERYTEEVFGAVSRSSQVWADEMKKEILATVDERAQIQRALEESKAKAAGPKGERIIVRTKMEEA